MLNDETASKYIFFYLTGMLKKLLLFIGCIFLKLDNLFRLLAEIFLHGTHSLPQLPLASQHYIWIKTFYIPTVKPEIEFY